MVKGSCEDATCPEAGELNTTLRISGKAESMRISVAMCTYNGVAHVGQQLDSILHQTRLPDELVVFDDESSDGTVRLIERNSRDAALEVRIYTGYGHVGPTRNFARAIKACKGQLIFLADQDDVWYPRKVAKVVQAFIGPHHPGAVFTDADLVDKELKPLGQRLWQAKMFGLSEQSAFRNGEAVRVLLKHNVVTGATMAFEKKWNEVTLPIPNGWVHDAWIALAIAAVSNVRPVDEPLMSYRRHSGQLIGAKSPSRVGLSRADYRLRRQSLVTMIERYEHAYRRLSELEEKLNDRSILPLVQEKITHLRTRTMLPRRFTARAMPIMKELAALRYHRYSMGLATAARDLLFGVEA